MIKLALLSPALLAFFMAAVEGVTADGTPAAAWWAPLVNTGAIGCVLIWFMFRNEPRLRNIEAAIDRASRTSLVLVMSVKGISREAQEMAQSLVTEIDTSTNRDKK